MAETKIKQYGYFKQNSFSNFHAITSKYSLSDLFGAITSKEITDLFKNMFNKSSEAISSLRYYPFDITGRNEMIEVDEYQTKMKIGKAEYNVGNYPVKDTFHTLLIGSSTKFKIGTFSRNDFFNREPYMQIQLYIPYIGFINIPPSEVIGQTLFAYCAVDLSTGVMTAFIQNEKNMIASQSAKIGVDVAWGSTNSTENTRNVINTLIATGISIVAAYASSGTSMIAESLAVVAGGTAFAKGALSIANSLQVQYQRGGVSGDMVALLQPNEPFLVIKRPRLIDIDETYAHTYGRPLYESRNLTAVHGFTIIDEVHLNGFGEATSIEINEIESLLKNGVIL